MPAMGKRRRRLLPSREVARRAVAGLTIGVAWVLVEAGAANMQAERGLRRQTAGLVVQNPRQLDVGQEQVNVAPGER